MDICGGVLNVAKVEVATSIEWERVKDAKHPAASHMALLEKCRSKLQ